jgi:cysteine-rich repeat protein
VLVPEGAGVATVQLYPYSSPATVNVFSGSCVAQTSQGCATMGPGSAGTISFPVTFGHTYPIEVSSAASWRISSAVCGDGQVDYSFGEECDDGNLQDHDGCSSRCKIETAQGTVDQSFLPADPACTNAQWFQQAISSASPVGQEFIPTTSVLLGVDVLIESPGSYFEPQPITLRIREGSITGSVLASITELGVYPAAFEHFDLPTPVSVTPGSRYVIELSTSEPGYQWDGWQVSEGCSYPGGSAIVSGTQVGAGFFFRTYGAAQ